MGESNAVVEKSLKSVFVGNIPYDVTEEKLRDIFGQVGPVISFKLMYDRESGKPKGYGFCEYKDQETALSAMRNLNAFEIGGRPLRVDNACTEKSRMEMQSLMQGPVIESPYGPDVDPNKAPEAISNAVASLPPEQMYELMRQMKLCVRNNPAEARTMLMSNPQLAYALLQAQVVMRIIDPKTAVQILHGSRDGADPIAPSIMSDQTLPGLGEPTITTPTIISNPEPPPVMNGGPKMAHGPPPQLPSTGGPPHNFPPQKNIGGPPQPVGPPTGGGMGGSHGPGGPHPTGVFGPGVGGPPNVPTSQNAPFSGGAGGGGDFDLRQLGNGPPASWRQQGPGSGPQSGPGDFDMRLPPSNMDGPPARDNYNMPPDQDFEGRFSNRENNRDFDQRDRFRDGPNRDRDRDQRDFHGRESRDNRDMRNPSGPMRDGRDRERERDLDFRGGPPMDGRDPRGRNYAPQENEFRGGPGGGPTPRGSSPGRGPPASAIPGIGSLPAGLAGQDQEKASLIMQVLQLSDEQIQMLPPEQQSSILQLKDQIQRSSQ